MAMVKISNKNSIRSIKLGRSFDLSLRYVADTADTIQLKVTPPLQISPAEKSVKKGSADMTIKCTVTHPNPSGKKIAFILEVTLDDDDEPMLIEGNP